jgi:hypothetical protein
MDPIALEKMEEATCKIFEDFSAFLGFNDLIWEQEEIIPKSTYPDNMNKFDMMAIQDEIIHFYRKVRDLLPEVNPDFLTVSRYFDTDLPSLLRRYIILHHKYWKHSRENCLRIYEVIQADFEDIPFIEDVNHFETLAEWRLHINQTIIMKYPHIFQIANIDIHFLQAKEV